MALVRNVPLLAALWILLTFFSSAGAQTPSNDSLPQGERYYVLQTNSDGMSNNFVLYPLTAPARLGAQQNIRGSLVLATTNTANSIQQGDIACISCDLVTYSSQNTDAATTVSLAAGSSPRAIVLFSNTSMHCAYDGDQSSVIYSMTNWNTSETLLRELQMGNSQAGPALIKSASGDSNGPNGSSTSTGGGNFDGRSPTTAVAMIILYSITGIITALFLIIIVVGAVRAHRHPERYGPRNMLGRPRQSRARGIARAMLETIPIVKFGEREEDKPTQRGNDLELGPTQRDAPAEEPPAVQVQRASTDLPPHTESHNEEITAAETVTTEKAHFSGGTPEAKTSMEANAENGLACSVCTDDFTKGQDVRVLPCNHKFHPECIDPWLLNVSGTCPLCRVDLRPTTSRPTDAEDPTGSGDPPHHADETGASTQHGDDITPHDRRRSRTGLSLYLQHTLNRRHMRDATPEERVAALRRLRAANEEPHSDSAHNRLSARLSRAFHHESRRGSGLNPENQSRQGSALTSDARSINDGSRPVSAVIPEDRRGSYAG